MATYTSTPLNALRNLGLSPLDLMTAIHNLPPDVELMLPLPAPHPFPQEPEISTLNLSPPRDSPEMSFTKFGELPLELRIKIWQHACFIQRSISLRLEHMGFVSVRSQDFDRRHKFSGYEFLSNTKPPAVLHVSKEARTFCLPHYDLSFGNSFAFDNLNITTFPRIYINWECDRICLLWPNDFQNDEYEPLSENCFSFFIDICERNKLRHLGLNVLRDEHWPYVDLATQIHSLEHIMLFASSTQDARLSVDSEIGFVDRETLAAEYPDLWKVMRTHSWAIRLEVPQRDLAKFCKMNMLNLQHAQEESSENTTIELWQPPKIETAYITFNGVPELSRQDW